MVLWVLTLLVFLTGASKTVSLLKEVRFSKDDEVQRQKTVEVTLVLRGLIQKIQSGEVPSDQDWSTLSSLASPWRETTQSVVQRIRQSGGRLLPALQRILESAEWQINLLDQARQQIGQAQAQAWLGLSLIPLLSILLYALFSSLQQHPFLWFGVATGAWSWSLVGAFWLQDIADRTRWAGLELRFRTLFFLSLSAYDRLRVEIETGLPPDLAWQALFDLNHEAHRDWADVWGLTVWRDGELLGGGRIASNSKLARAIEQGGTDLKLAIRQSLMEGRGCIERISAVAQTFRQDVNRTIQTELARLPILALRPLFVCMAPSLLALVGLVLVLSISELWA